MTTQTEITPATKAQIDALIELCKEYELYNAAGFLQLASDELTEVANGKPTCTGTDQIRCDDPQCPVHGKTTGAFSDADIKADYQERNDLYAMGMGH